MSEQGIQYLDPRAEPSAPIEVYELGLDLSAEGLTLGLMANGFPDSVNFLDRVEDALGEQHANLTIRRYDKGDPTISAPDDLLDTIAADCQGVIAAYGH